MLCAANASTRQNAWRRAATMFPLRLSTNLAQFERHYFITAYATLLSLASCHSRRRQKLQIRSRAISNPWEMLAHKLSMTLMACVDTGTNRNGYGMRLGREGCSISTLAKSHNGPVRRRRNHHQILPPWSDSASSLQHRDQKHYAMITRTTTNWTTQRGKSGFLRSCQAKTMNL